MADNNTTPSTDNDPAQDNTSNAGIPGIPQTPQHGPNDLERPTIRSWEINVLGTFLIITLVMVGYLIYAFWPQLKTQDDPKSWKEETSIWCSACEKSHKNTPPSAQPITTDSVATSISNPVNTNCNKEEHCSWIFTLGADQRVILLVLLAGALGSLIHAATSFSNYVGQGKIEKSWIWWYLLRPFIGMGIAFVFYMVFRGGLLSDTRIESVNLSGILTLSALSGLFTDRATIKLEEIFQSLFQPKDTRSGKLTTKTDVQSDNNAQG